MRVQVASSSQIISTWARVTTHAAINVDGLPPVTRAQVEMICEELATWTRMFCGAKAECKYLAKDSPGIEV